MTDVLLVSMPLSTPTRPSIALGLLKACLARTGLVSRGHHAYLHFIKALGPALHRALESTLAEELVGEWLFTAAAFPGFSTRAADLLEGSSVQALHAHFGAQADLAAAMENLRAVCTRFVEDTAALILAEKPRIVACTSTFQQHVASLALLRRVRELDPTVITVLGGANCEGPMGLVAAQSFPWVDYVFSGEADEAVGPFFRDLLEHGYAAPLPDGAIRQGSAPDPPPRAVVNRLAGLPSPDYDDYFAEFPRLGLEPPKNPMLLVETSRGCWWGQKHHCTFCGLNGKGMNFRSKPPAEALAEFDGLASRYGSRTFYVVDNILDMSYFKTVLPQLAERDYSIFYETKANLKRDQMRQLARAGIRYLQPGIESLHDDLLRLMDKGTTTVQNLQILRWAREETIDILWLNLWGFPGEKDEWYGQMASWWPLVSHLQPPRSLVRLTFQRFSPYHKRAGDFGLKLRPHRKYQHVYPLEPAVLNELAYNFEDESRDLGEGRGRFHYEPGFQALREAFRGWTAAYPEASLTMRDEGELLIVRDTRPVALQEHVQLRGLERDIYLACDGAVAPASLSSALSRPWEELAAVVAALQERKLLLDLNGRLLSLATYDNSVRGIEMLERAMAQQS